MSSPRSRKPSVNICLPSGLGTGTVKLIGPLVNSTGCGAFLDRKSLFSRLAKIELRPFRIDRKTKYFPSAVQAPPQSFLTRQSGNRGCKFEPSRAISQMEDPPRSELPGAQVENRNTLPSGDHRRYAEFPCRSASFRKSLPSALAISSSCTLAMAIDWPSGDQAASIAKISPRRRGAALPGTLSAQSGDIATWVRIKSSERTGE